MKTRIFEITGELSIETAKNTKVFCYDYADIKEIEGFKYLGKIKNSDGEEIIYGSCSLYDKVKFYNFSHLNSNPFISEKDFNEAFEEMSSSDFFAPCVFLNEEDMMESLNDYIEEYEC